ncbi:hypothetical protein ABDK00_003165 [Niabella insulamsoli]|uniref:hypothetical protein n=1 Tax=Niabella insulamsoli TaxID=3144874 RepID=UPI0031FCD7E3
MQDELKHILSDKKEAISREQLLQYLNGEMEPAEKHDFEQKIIDDPFEADALEGLDELQDKKRIELIVDDLNRSLRKKTAKKVNSRKRLQLKTPWTLYFSAILLLILIALIFIFLHRQLNS